MKNNFLIITILLLCPTLTVTDGSKLQKHTKSGYESLINTTREITNACSFIEDKDSNELLVSVADFEAVYPVKVDSVYKVIRDMEKYPQYLPRIKKLSVTKKINANEENMRTYMVVTFMSINTDYDYEMNVRFEQPAPGCYAVQSTMLKSYDKKFDSISSSWYMEEIMIGNKPHTYFRLYMRTVFRDFLPGQKYIVKKFNTNDSADTIRRICKRAAEQTK